ncbi:hypothetical protein [Jatrophihabitans endophyticus]|uniref:hypothetical protein n=1 Tax=Jatrophihabitans endophyticus TaxID=1206085 RepID=UPI0019EED938|nr:hypothetical protein [Jatrophihabitans endophyticus]MBE7187009.1 hypothetical protein [Jatrophihabitans endophyticus]
MLDLPSALTRRATLALVTALFLAAAAVMLAVSGPAHAAPARAPKCPSKTYFLHQLQKKNKGAKKVDRKQCAGQWAGVIASTSTYNYNSLFQHTKGSTWVSRPRNKKNCAAIPKKLDYICQGS